MEMIGEGGGWWGVGANGRELRKGGEAALSLGVNKPLIRGYW